MRSLILFLYERADAALLWLLAALALALLAWLAGLAVLTLRKKGRRLRFTAWCLGAVLALVLAAALFLQADVLYEDCEAARLAGLDSRVRSCSVIPVSIAAMDVDLEFFTVSLADEPGFVFDVAPQDLVADLGGPDQGETVYALSRSVEREFGGPTEFITGGWLLYVRDKGSPDGFAVNRTVRFLVAGDRPDCASCDTIYRSVRTY